MGAAAVIGSIITSVVVSKAVSVIGEKIGLDENLTSIIGTVAGAYAGATTYNAATAGAETATAGMDLSAGVAGTVSNVPGTPIAPMAPAASNIPGTPLASAGSPYASAPSAGAVTRPPTRGGMLSSPGPDIPTAGGPPSQLSSQPTRPTPGTDTAGRIIESSTVGGGGGRKGVAEQSWAERLFSPEKTMDLIMAGVQGYGEAGMREYELEYPEKVATQNARDWAAQYPGQKSLRQPNYPSQGGG